MLANVSDQAIQAQWAWDAGANGIEGGSVQLKRITADVNDGVEMLPQVLTRDLALPARSIVAFEVTPAADEDVER